MEFFWEVFGEMNSSLGKRSDRPSPLIHSTVSGTSWTPLSRSRNRMSRTSTSLCLRARETFQVKLRGRFLPLLEDGTDEDISNHHLSHSTLKEMRGKEEGLSKMKLLGTKENGTNRSTFNPKSQVLFSAFSTVCFRFLQVKTQLIRLNCRNYLSRGDSLYSWHDYPSSPPCPQPLQALPTQTDYECKWIGEICRLIFFFFFFVEHLASLPQRSCIRRPWGRRGLAAVAAIAQKYLSYLPSH